MENKIENLKKEEAALWEKIAEIKQEIEKAEKSEVIKAAEEKLKILRDTEDKITLEMKAKIEFLREEEVSVQKQIADRKEEFKVTEKQLANQKSDHVKAVENKLLSLVVEDQKLSENIKLKKHRAVDLNKVLTFLLEKTKKVKVNLDQLITTEDLKKELIAEINDDLSEKEITLAGIESELENKSKELQETKENYTELTQRMEAKSKKLQDIDSNLILKSNQISKISVDLSSVEEVAERLLAEAKNYEIRRDDAHRQLMAEREQYNKLIEENNKLKEVLPLLEKRKIEIKQSNLSLETRFAEMLQNLTEEMNQINKNRSALEKIILKKEKDIDEKDHLLTEKVDALEESERVLSMRQVEINSFENLLKTINEQNDLLKDELLKLDKKATGHRNLINDLQLETELLQKKKIAVENNLQEVLYSMNNKLKRTTDTEVKLNSEIKEYENRLTELNTSIKESMTELVDLQTSLTNTKLEHEEHRTGITKFVSMKKKLQKEISKHQVVLEKYQKISEKIKFEQAMMLKERASKIEENTSVKGVKINRTSNPGDPFIKV